MSEESTVDELNSQAATSPLCQQILRLRISPVVPTSVDKTRFRPERLHADYPSTGEQSRSLPISRLHRTNPAVEAG